METGIVRGNLRAIGNFGNRKGRRTKNKFFKAMEKVSSVKEMPRWVSYVRRASEKEDSKGIDAVIVTDAGELFIQIKSSETGANEFKNRRHCQHLTIWVIVILEHHTPEDICEETKSILAQFRRSIFNVPGDIGDIE